MDEALGDRRGGKREIGAFLTGKAHTYDDFYEVGREKIREYADAVKDFHPAHWTEQGAEQLEYPGLLASPTFLATLSWKVMMQFLDAHEVGVDLGRMVQTEQAFTYHRPLIAGTRLDAEFRVGEYREFGPTDTFHVHTAFIDHDSRELIQEVDTTYVKYSSRDDVRLGHQADKSPATMQSLHG